MADRQRIGRELLTLPVFQAVPLEGLNEIADGLAAYRCMRRECRALFVVQDSTWRRHLQSHPWPSRPCPYCFKPSHIPEES